MQYKTKEFKFYNIYRMASIVEECVLNFHSLVELHWDEKKTLQALIKPAKLSLLHQYIYAMISVTSHENFRDNADLYWDSYDNDKDENSLAKQIDNDFITYSIDFEPFAEFVRRTKRVDDNSDWFYEWFLSEEHHFEDLWEKLTDEVFHILFSNRTFLLNFNQALAKFLRNEKILIPSEYLDTKGVIARTPHIPAWLKKSVFYRDHGRCVFCQKDLSGLLSTDRVLHYDHIVPLNLWGTNDPSNFQLLCEDCNLRKSGSIAKTAYRYPPWWDY